jgi:regulatory protein
MAESMTFENALSRLQAWCAHEERCVADIRRKAASLGISPAFVRRIVERLRKDGFINELRYSRAFCRGKFLNNHWGRNRIIAELRSRGIDTPTIEAAMTEIDPEAYHAALRKLIATKYKEERTDSFENRIKISRFLIQKGYEPDLVRQHLIITPEE